MLWKRDALVSLESMVKTEFWGSVCMNDLAKGVHKNWVKPRLSPGKIVYTNATLL